MSGQLAANQPATPRPRPPLASLLVRRALEEIYLPRKPQEIIPRGKKLNDQVLRGIGNVPLTYLEFGVHKGWSMRQITHRFRDPASRFVGFDSFEGLPEAWDGLDTGHFSTGGATPAIPDKRLRFIKGWFQDTLPGFLAEGPVTGTVLVHFDADLYSSTLFLLATLWHHIPDYYFVFDEFVPSEIVALYDFQRAFPVEFEYFAAAVDGNNNPINIFGRMKRTNLRPATVPLASGERAPPV